jgi:hypothetical protein
MEKKGNLYCEQIQDIVYYTPEMPSRKHFLNGHVSKKADQYFQRTEVPDNLEDMPQEEQDAIITREWDRRINGAWFFNNGEPTYITGIHYYYLNYYRLDIGFPDYRDADRRFFWMWDYCVKDENCFGLLYITRRQQGKSYKSGCIALDFVTRTFDVHVGIQSKNDTDAKKFFLRSVVRPWRKLPFFFSPKNSASTNPQDKIEFVAAAKRGAGAKSTSGRVNIEAELGSWIDYENSQDNAYDGEKLALFVNDEIFKEQKFDPIERLSIVQKTQEQSGKIIAKSINISTIEQMGGKGLNRGKEMWASSDPNNRDGNGRTISGLYRLLEPCYRGHDIDKYGHDNIEANKAYFKGRRSKLSGARLLAERRANPFDEKDAFCLDGKDCIYDAAVIDECIRQVEHFEDVNRRPPFTRYRLQWTDVNRSKVEAIPDERGRFLFSWLPPTDAELNQVQPVGTIETRHGQVTRYMPLNNHRFCVSSDPIDKSITTDKRNSNPSGHGFRKYDMMVEGDLQAKDYWPSHSFIFEYLERPKVKEIFYEDMVMACHLLGCEILFENQRSLIEDHFNERGYDLFLATRPDFTHTKNTKTQTAKGVPSSTLTIGQYVELTENFIHGPLSEDWRRCPFPRTLNDWLNFDPGNTTKFDAGVSASYGLMAAARFIKPKKPPVEINSLNLSYREY